MHGSERVFSGLVDIHFDFKSHFPPLQRLKQGTPDFHNFIKTAKRYQEQLVSLIDLGKAFSDSLMKLSTNFRGDLEEGIRKMAEAQREIERRRLEMSEHLLREVVQPLGRSVESESRYELPAFEKEYQKKRTKLTRELKDIENETKKMGTRKKQQTPEELQKNIKILTEKVKDLDRLRSEALRQVLLMERKRGCDFLRMWTRVMEQQLYQFTEGYNILNDNRQFWADLAASRDQLPGDDVALLASVSAMTAERTFVPLQTAATTNNPSAFSGDQMSNNGHHQMNVAPMQNQSYSHQAPSQSYDQSLQTNHEGQYQETTGYDDLPPAPQEYGQDEFMPDEDLPPPPPQDEWQTDTAYENTYDGGYGGGNQPKCRVLFEYEGQREDELSLQPGDIVTILREDEGWWEGEINGVVGLFPSNFCERI